MKRIFLFFAMAMMSILTMAQAPQKMNFQALVRNSANELVTNQSVSIEISVLNGSNTAVYTETQTVTTNANGVATLVIGEGTATKGSFAEIDWSAGNYYMQTTVNLGGGLGAVVGTSPLLSVPYALYAEKAGNTYTKEEVDALLAALESKIDEGGSTPISGDVKKENGAIKAAFSVSADKQVYFSQGNLQYNAKSQDWRFAENQYDMIGEDNANIASDYDGYIDLFGWGTSGYNNINPYSISDYAFSGESSDIAGTNYDWGVYNAISNGGNAAGMWRTLISSEWSYVLSGRTDASSLKGSATVNGVNGMILLPDDWSTPDGITFNSGMNGYFDNTYSTSEWSKMEANGAVFLPAAGYRLGSDVYSVGSRGDYWSSSANDDYGSACYLHFSSGYANVYATFRDYCYSVRLVRDL